MLKTIVPEAKNSFAIGLEFPSASGGAGMDVGPHRVRWEQQATN